MSAKDGARFSGLLCWGQPGVHSDRQRLTQAEGWQPLPAIARDSSLVCSAHGYCRGGRGETPEVRPRSAALSRKKRPDSKACGGRGECRLSHHIGWTQFVIKALHLLSVDEVGTIISHCRFCLHLLTVNSAQVHPPSI